MHRCEHSQEKEPSTWIKHIHPKEIIGKLDEGIMIWFRFGRGFLIVSIQLCV
jgi:hypothetical protein